MTDADSLTQIGQTFGVWGAIVIFSIYLIYQIVKDILSIKKKKAENIEAVEFKKQLATQMSDNAKTNSEILKYLKIANQKYMDEISETQARILIDSVFDASQNKILFYINRIMCDNHIHGNEKEISAKIKSFISNKFHQDILCLKEFQYNGVSLSEYMNESWKDILIETVTGIVINEKGEKALISTIQNYYDGFKYELFDNLF